MPDRDSRTKTHYAYPLVAGAHQELRGQGLQARVVADSARNSLPAPDNYHWGFPGAVRRHPGWEQFPENWRVSDLFITAARTVPRLQLLQFNHAHDANARFRLRSPELRDLEAALPQIATHRNASFGSSRQKAGP